MIFEVALSLKCIALTRLSIEPRLKNSPVRTSFVDLNLTDTNERLQENYRGLRTTPLAL
jgi:hypothetical protein